MVCPPRLAVESLRHRLYGGLLLGPRLLRAVLPERVARRSTLLADSTGPSTSGGDATAAYRRRSRRSRATPRRLDSAATLSSGGLHQRHPELSAGRRPRPPKPHAPVYNLLVRPSPIPILFDEQKAAPEAGPGARPHAGELADRHPPPARVVSLAGGIARIPQIRRELAATSVHRETRAAPLEILSPGAGAVPRPWARPGRRSLHLARRPFGTTERGAEVFPEGAFERWGAVPAARRRLGRDRRGGKSSSPCWCSPPS